MRNAPQERTEPAGAAFLFRFSVLTWVAGCFGMTAGSAVALTGIGGTLMFIGILVFFIVIGMTIFAGKKGEAPEDVPWSETLTAPALKGWEPKLDRLTWWVVAAVVLILIAYGPFFASYLPPNFVSPGFRVW